ncbi:hypothetical protein [Exiguobacterium oxidotolerans]|uniref:hypothetical protein n=1 Tax=Exiguobacterium oxidotolerans TaxID=223958 RepID=UPI00049414E7|nr:hypothetical protein [Exiguobacterium oxidotolerans]
MKQRAKKRKRLKLAEKQIRSVKVGYVSRRQINKMAKDLIRLEDKKRMIIDPVRIFEAFKSFARKVVETIKAIYESVVKKVRTVFDEYHEIKKQRHAIKYNPPLRTMIPTNVVHQANTGSSGFMIHRQKR